MIPQRLPAVTSIPFSGRHREGRIASKQLQQRFDTTTTNFMDRVEASTHYPCVKRAEYLGEHPEPSPGRVE